MSTNSVKKKKKYNLLKVHICWSYITNSGLNNSNLYKKFFVVCVCSVLHGLCVLDNIVLSLANWLLRLVQKKKKEM